MKNFFDEDLPDKIEQETKNRLNHTIWVEKYRPISLDTFIGNETIKSKFQKYIDENDPPNLLLFGSAGTGKTTAAKILANNIECDYLYINASDENSVDVMRDKIKGFASAIGFTDLKIVILDEADFLSRSSAAALRNILETFSQHTRFILTCNYIENIIEPIVSRCQVFNVIPPSKKDIAIHLAKILKTENIQFSLEDVSFLVNSYYPDIRGTIGAAQQSSMNGKLTLDKQNIIDADYKLKIIEILKDKSKDRKIAFKEIRQILADNSISDFSNIYKLLYDTIDEYATGNIAAVILIIAEMEYKSSFVVDKEINFCSAIIQVLEKIK